MRGSRIIAALLLSAGLAGCVAAPRPPQPAPLVAVPGPTKTEAEFRRDDTVCRAAAVVLPPNPSAAQPSAAAAAAPVKLEPAKPAEPVQASPPPDLVYLRCMEARQNTIEALAPAIPVYYSYYPAYPVYGGSPFFFNSFVGFGFYGGHYGRHYGGFHGGGFHHGGFGRGGFHR